VEISFWLKWFDWDAKFRAKVTMKGAEIMHPSFVAFYDGVAAAEPVLPDAKRAT
jgi:hypothetical protein